MTSIVLGPLSSSLLLSTSVQLIRFLLQTNRVARCQIFNRTVRHFSSLSGIILIVIPDNTCVNSSIVVTKTLARRVSGILGRATWQAYSLIINQTVVEIDTKVYIFRLSAH